MRRTSGDRPRLVHTIAEVRAAVAAARSQGMRVAFVPTMGALHEGHRALVRAAGERGEFVIVSIFVNPLQFGPNEDLDRYPRTLESDIVAVTGLADLVFAPTVTEMYPDGASATRIAGGPVAALYEGAARPGHFDGMLTVVAKLLNIVQCDTVVFGQKDAQQVFLVRQLVRDLNLPLDVAVAETVREDDGLARSSRNRYLSQGDRALALVLSRSIREAAAAARGGADAALAAGLRVFEAAPAVRLDYLVVVDPATFQQVGADHRGAALVLVAARVGQTRLIDNGFITLDAGTQTEHQQTEHQQDAPANREPGMTEPNLEATVTDEDTSQQKAVRLAKRQQLIDAAPDAGGGAYPVTVPVTDSIPELRGRFSELAADETTGVTVGVAGRVVHARNTGKLCFASLQSGDGSRIQAMVSLAEVGEESLAAWKELVDLGDHVFVSGEVVSSRRGELSIMVREWQIAAKAILPLPNLHNELSEETRVRSRYLDLIARAQARTNVLERAAVVASLRQTFVERGFVEVETPMLQVMHGGAAARPFVTHSNAFDTDLYLRIAPELYLKRAVVGGIERVYEINRNFRNEGADSTHSPEFAMLELYQAYGDYNTMAELTQVMVQNAAEAITGGSRVVTWADGTEYDLGGEWERISMYDSLSAAAGLRITPQTSVDELRELASVQGIELEHPSHGKYVEELWEHHVKPSLERPTFVRDFPVETSPLVRAHRSIPGVVEKWDLYIRGFELATGYSELVDPVVQRERFVEQATLAAGGDLEAMRLDEEFLRALEFGMPPTGGMGMGIDRLLMALTGLGIRETILFPLVK